MTPSVFSRGRSCVGLAVVLALGSVARYPGGTALDRSSASYSLSRNFLSDLGMTVAHDGRPNVLGASLFVASLLLLVLGLGGCLVGFVRLYSRVPRARGLARAAGAAGLLVCAAFVGVAATPENRALALHVGLTAAAFRIFPFVAILLAVASLTSDVLPRRAGIAWVALAVVLTAYTVVREWGPHIARVEGLVVQVVAQKIVTVTAVSVLVYLSVEADRVLVAARPDQ